RTFVPPPGKANVYVIRPYNFIGSAVLWTVTLDFRAFGNLGLRSYLYGVVEPGEHFVGSSTPGGSPHPVRFSPFHRPHHFFTMSAGWNIAPLDEQGGRNRVLDYTPSGDTQFELLESQSPPK